MKIKNKLISLGLSVSIILYSTKPVNSIPVVIPIAVCATLCKVFATVVIGIGLNKINRTVYYHTKNKIYYYLDSNDSKKLLRMAKVTNIGTIEAKSLVIAVNKCKELAKMRGVKHLRAIAIKGGKFICIAMW